MATSDFRDDKDGIEMLMAFDTNGQARWIEFRDGTRYTVSPESGPMPPDTFRGGPLKNINLLKAEVFEILKWEELDEKGNVVKTHLCPHILCRLYC